MQFAVWVLVVAAFLSLIALLVSELLPTNALHSPLAQFLKLNDPFRSWWFDALLGVLSVSLLACIIERAPMLFRQAFSHTFRWSEKQYDEQNLGYRFSKGVNEQAVLNLFKDLGLTVKEQRQDHKVAFSAKQGGVSRLGPLMTHLGMLLLILGGLATGITGKSTAISGGSGDLVRHPDWDFSLRIDDFRLEYHPVSLNQWVEVPGGMRGQVIEVLSDSARLKFSSHQGDGIVKTYPLDSLEVGFLVSSKGRESIYQGNIRSYVTEATVLVDTIEVLHKSIEVNHPLRFRGYRFYQSSFDMLDTKTEVDSVVILYQDSSGVEVNVTLTVEGSPVIVPGTGVQLTAGKFLPDFKLDGDMQAYSATDRMQNPAVRITVQRPDEESLSKWVFPRDLGMMGHSAAGTNLKLVDVQGVKSLPGGFITILNVNKSRGLGLIWAGFLIATLGLILVYLVTYRSAWALVINHQSGAQTVYLTGISHRDEASFKVKFDESVKKIMKTLE